MLICISLYLSTDAYLNREVRIKVLSTMPNELSFAVFRTLRGLSVQTEVHELKIQTNGCMRRFSNIDI